MPHLELDGGFRLYYERHGAGPTVLFAHGAGGNAMAWWQQVPAFSARFTVVTFDHRAFGRSPDVDGGPGWRAFGEDTLALLDHLEVERLHVVAHSMGGRTAAGLIRRCPDRIASITYSGTTGGAVDERSRARRAELESEGYFEGSLLRRALAEGVYEQSPEVAFLYRQLRAINPPRPRDFLAPCADPAVAAAARCRERSSNAGRRSSGSPASTTASWRRSWCAARTNSRRAPASSWSRTPATPPTSSAPTTGTPPCSASSTRWRRRRGRRSRDLPEAAP